jgi:hypothetical protein
MLGKNTSRNKPQEASVEDITSFGIWLHVSGQEYFLDYVKYPWFQDATIRQITNVKFTNGFHLYWPHLDIDLELDSLQHPEAYPLSYKIGLSVPG